MAKIVIAGKCDCPYYAKVELLADSLVKNLPDFKLNKIVITEEEWEDWLQNTCEERGWEHKKSPIVWRELVERGGKGVLIGGANDFQEYALYYYNIKSNFTSHDMKAIGGENAQTKKEIDEEWKAFKESSKPIKICITNANSGPAYSMIKPLCSGEVFGEGVEVSLCLLCDEDLRDVVKGTAMEAFDLALPLLRKISVTSDVHDAFNDCTAIIVLDEIAQIEEESREEWMKKNYNYFTEYAKIINDVSRTDVRVVVAGDGPLNFNVSMMIKSAPKIPRQNIVACPRQYENEVKSILAEKLNVNTAGVTNTIIWGNINGSNSIDIRNARVHNYEGAIRGPPSFSLAVTEMIYDKKWLDGEFYEIATKRRGMAEELMKHRKSMSQGTAVASLLKHWWNGDHDGQLFSLGVHSDGLFGIPAGIVSSCPVNFSTPGYWTMVEEPKLDEEMKEKLKSIVKELQLEERIIFPTEEDLKSASEEKEALEKIKEDKEGEEKEEKVEGKENEDNKEKSEPTSQEEEKTENDAENEKTD